MTALRVLGTHCFQMRHTTHWRARMDTATAQKVAMAAPHRPQPSPASGIIQKFKGMATATMVQLRPMVCR